MAESRGFESTRPCLGALLAVLAAAALVMTASPSAAEAGIYQVRECFPNEPGATTLRDGYFESGNRGGNHSYLASDRDCSDGFAFVGTGDCGYGSACTDPATYNEYGRWMLEAPNTTAINRFSASYFSEAHYGHVAYLRVEHIGGGSSYMTYNDSSGSYLSDSKTWPWSGSPTSNKIYWQIACPLASCGQSAASGIWIHYLEFAMTDSEAPTISDYSETISGGWKKPRATEAVSLKANDRGSGVHALDITVDGLEARSHGYDCLISQNGYAAQFSPCKNELTRTYNTDAIDTGAPPFHNGINNVSVCARDYANLGSTPNRTCRTGVAKIDGEEPEQVISGNGWPADGSALTAGEKTISVTATDGVEGGSNAQRRSGVKEIQLRVWNPDEEARPNYPTTRVRQADAACGDTRDSCGLDGSFHFHPDNYVYEAATTPIKVEVTSVDELGNTRQEVRTLAYTTDVDSPLVTLDTTEVPGVGTLAQISAQDPAGTDGGTVSSGVARIELLVDGQVVRQWNCPTSGCQPQVHVLNSSQAPSSHEITAYATDRAFNRGFERAGVVEEREYQFFGYNDAFQHGDWFQQAGEPTGPAANIRRGLEAAAEGGARVIRVQVQGCLVAENTGLLQEEIPLPPSDWRWDAYYQTFFEQVREYNRRPIPDLKVVAHLTDSPPWANPNGAEDADQTTPAHLGSCHGDGAATVMPPSENATGDGFYYDLVYGFLDKYARDPLNGIIAVQAWNEPNAPGWWGSTQGKKEFDEDNDEDPDHFAHLVNIASKAVQDYGGGVRILPGALSPAGTHPRVYLTDVLTDDGGEVAPPHSSLPNHVPLTRPDGSENIDAWAAHLYSRNDTEERGRNGSKIRGARTRINHQFRQIEQSLSATNAGDLPIWITELGFAARPNGTAQSEKQSERFLWAYDRLAEENVEALIVHRVLEPIDPRDSEYVDRLAVIHRVVTDAGHVWEPRPAYCDLAQTQGDSPSRNCS